MSTPTTGTTPAVPTGPDPVEVNAVLSLINQYGLGELWQGVYSLMEEGYTDADQILTIISTDSTPQGKQYQEAFFRRFPAIKVQREENQRRMNQGLTPIPEMSPTSYIATEQAYVDAVSDTDPSLASTENITAWMTGSGEYDRPVSPDEVRARIGVYRDYLYSPSNAEVRRELRDIYGLSEQDMLNYVMADETGREQLRLDFDRNMRRANIGAQARSRGMVLSNSLRDEIEASGAGFTYGDTASRFANVEYDADTYTKLSAMAGVNTSRDDLIREEFDLSGGASTTKLKRRLASQERARFSTSSAVGNNSLRVGGLGTQ